MKSSLPLLIVCVAFVTMTGCSNSGPAPGSQSAPAATDPQRGGTRSVDIVIAPETLAKIGLTVDRAVVRDAGGTLSVPATVIPTQSGLAHVGPLVSGRVSSLHVREGASVLKGQALASVEGPEIWEMYAALVRTNAELERTKAEFDRQTTLSHERIGSAKAFQDADAAWKQAQSAFQAADKRLHAMGMSDEDVKATLRDADHHSTALIVRAPIAGIVSRRFVALGEFIEPNKDLFEVLDTRSVWIDAVVQPRDARAIRAGDSAAFVSADGMRTRATVIFVSPMLDDATRSLTVRAEASNAAGALRPQTFGTLDVFAHQNRPALCVPAASIIDEGSGTFVFVRVNDTTYRHTAVTCGPAAGGGVEILAGLKDGDDVVSGGVFYLKSMLKRDALQENGGEAK